MPECHLGTAIPELPSMDVGAALSFYQERLGFTETYRFGEAPVVFGIVCRDDARLHLWLCDDPRLPRNSSCGIPVRNIDAAYRECVERGVVHPNGHLKTQPWGMREFVAVDRDGNALRFFERV